MQTMLPMNRHGTAIHSASRMTTGRESRTHSAAHVNVNGSRRFLAA